MAETASSGGMRSMDRKSSIEREPRTLGFNQIQYAREVALYVVRTRSEEEAMSIFTEGLQPVENVSNQNKNDMDINGEELENLADEFQVPPIPREVASAPF